MYKNLINMYKNLIEKVRYTVLVERGVIGYQLCFFLGVYDRRYSLPHLQFTVSSVNLDFISGQIDWSQTLIEIMYCTVLFLRRNVFHFIFRVETSPSHAAIISVVIKSNFCVELELCDFFYSLRRQLEKRPLPLKSL